MGVDRSVESLEIVAEDAADDLLAAEHTARLAQQQAEQAHLRRRQPDLTLAHVAGELGDVEREPARADLRGPRLLPHPRGAPQDSAHSRRKLAGAERLRDVVVCAGVQPPQAVLLVHARRQHDDRDVRLRAQRLAHLRPVELREHQVEHDEVRLALASEPQPLLAVRGRQHLVAVVPEVPGHEIGGRRVVFNDEDGASHSDSLSSGRIPNPSGRRTSCTGQLSRKDEVPRVAQYTQGRSSAGPRA